MEEEIFRHENKEIRPAKFAATGIKKSGNY
jgi:hypothetical protein